MTVLRFQRVECISVADITKQLPAGTFTTMSAPSPAHMVDVTVSAGGVNDATTYMTSRGYTLFATDPANTLDQAAAAIVTPINRVKLPDNTVLTMGAVADGQIVSRSGTSLVGAAASGFDIRDQVAFDHFVAGSVTSERIGVMGWLSSTSGTGSDLVIGGEAGHPGFLDLGAGTVAAGRTSVYVGDASFPLAVLNGTQGQVAIEWLIRFNANALLTANMERFTVGFGDQFGGAASVEHSNGVYCEFDPLASANFRLVNALATSRTRIDSTIAVTANNWWRIGLQVTYPGGVPTSSLLVNGVVRATSTLNFPTAGFGFGIRIESQATASEARVQADYMKLVQVTEKET